MAISLFFAISIILNNFAHGSRIADNIGMGNGTEYCTKKIRNDDRLIVLDDMGVPITDYGYLQGEFVGPIRYPITISNIALSYYDLTTNSNDTELRTMRYFDAFEAAPGNNSLYTFLANANWLRENARSYGNYSTFDHRFTLPYPPYAILPPWRSAMAQGLAIDVLAKAYKITGNMNYLETAKKLLKAFYIDAKDGGVTHLPHDPSDGWWYELLANDQGIEPRVLNGHMFAMIGLNAYYNITQDASAKFLFEKGILALKQELPRYDTRHNYSYYDDSKKLSPLHYHRIVVQQLEDLYKISHEPTLKRYHDKWVSYDVPATIIRSLTCKESLNPPKLVFKISDSNLRIGTANQFSRDNNASVEGGEIQNSHYTVHKPSDFPGLKFSSQFINYRADNVTIKVPERNLSKDVQVIITLNIEGIKQKDYELRIVFGSDIESQVPGWNSDHQVYTNKTEIGESAVVRPLSIIGNDYLRIKNIDLFISNQAMLDKLDYIIDLQ